MSIANGAVWDGEAGVLLNYEFTDLYEDLLTVTKGSKTINDIDVSGATFLDIRSDSTRAAATEYSARITSLSRLNSLVDDGKIAGNTSLWLNVSEDGAVTIFLTSAKIS